MSEANVLFRVDAGPGIGLGHLQRCLSLAMALGSDDVGCAFLTNRNRDAESRTIELGFDAVAAGGGPTGSSEDLQRTLSVAEEIGCRAVVVDSYNVDSDYVMSLRRAGLLVACVDDLNQHPFPAHIVTNGGAHATGLKYLSGTGDTTYLLGPEFALLGPEYGRPTNRTGDGTVENVLVTLGGSDPRLLMPGLLSMLDDVTGSFQVTAIIGPFFGNRAKVEASARSSRRAVRLVCDPPSMRDHQLEADMAISAGGQTLYELAATGTPAVALQMVANQRESLEALEAGGVVRHAGFVEEPALLGKIADEVTKLLSDPEAREKMSLAGRTCVDGAGASRVAAEIASRL